MRVVDRNMLVASILWAVVAGISCSSKRRVTSPPPDDAQVSVAPFSASPSDAGSADAMGEIVLSPSLPATRAQTLAEIDQLLAKHTLEGNAGGFTWRIGDGPGDTYVLRGTPHSDRKDSPVRYHVKAGALGENLIIMRSLRSDVPDTVVLSCAGEDSSGNPAGSHARCFHNQDKKPGAYSPSTIWIHVGPGVEPARRLRRLLLHLLFTLDQRPVPPPRTKMPLPATRRETLDKANKMLERYHKASQPRDSRESDDWRFEIRPPGTLVVRWSASQMHDRGVFSIPIDRLARNLVVESSLYGESKYPPNSLILSCRRSPVVNDKVQGCIGYRRYVPAFPPDPPGLGPRKQFNNVSLFFPSDKKLVNDIRALLYHAMFTLKG